MSDGDDLAGALDASRVFLDACEVFDVTPVQALGLVRWLCETRPDVQRAVVQRACDPAWKPLA